MQIFYATNHLEIWMHEWQQSLMLTDLKDSSSTDHNVLWCINLDKSLSHQPDSLSVSRLLQGKKEEEINWERVVKVNEGNSKASYFLFVLDRLCGYELCEYYSVSPRNAQTHKAPVL